jgi:hypothetical protein
MGTKSSGEGEEVVEVGGKPLPHLGRMRGPKKMYLRRDLPKILPIKASRKKNNHKDDEN